ncbi:MAG: CDP-alcohol phosphatidyltransferase family protein, partial [Candidatus Verstraetearchaeota archaeon]|nr:CDP-alcohol phosphatidyltransferase family protein [Candidatus Verstraetearchaeota archaeon]
VLDRYSDLLVLGAITLSGLCDPVAGLAALVGSVMVSYVRARGENEGVRMSGVGLMERAERMILVSATAMLDMLDVGILLLAFLTNLTVAQRLYHIWRSLSRRV